MTKTILALSLMLAACGGADFGTRSEEGQAGAVAAVEPADSAPLAAAAGAPTMTSAGGSAALVGAGGSPSAAGGQASAAGGSAGQGGQPEASAGGSSQGAGGSSQAGGSSSLGGGGSSQGGYPGTHCGEPGHAGAPSSTDPACNSWPVGECGAGCYGEHYGCRWVGAGNADCDGAHDASGAYLGFEWVCPLSAPTLPGCVPPIQQPSAETQAACCDASAAPVRP